MSSPWEAALAILCMVFLVGVSYFILKGLSCFLLTFALLSVGWAAPIVPVRKPAEVRTIDSTNRILLLKTKAGISTVTSDSLALALGLKPEKHPKRLTQWRQFSIPPGKDKADIIQTLKRSGRFDHVVEPQTYTTQETVPNDPMFPQLWGMTNIMAPAAWDRIKEAPDVVVAVVDTGIDFTHPDLVENLWTGPNGEHGYVATNGVVLEGGQDDHGHGTHVAGTIGAVGNNGVGVVGLAWRTQIIAMKVLHNGSGTSLDIVNGLEKLVELRESGLPLLVSNHSYGGAGLDPFMEDGFKMLADADIFVAAAAGNSAQNIDSSPFSPASYTFNNMVVALASDSTGKKASFSNFGLIGTDITAPGVGIWSTTRTNTYSSFSGTSMASPHVAGLATLVRALNRGLTAAQTREVLLHPDSYDSGNYLSSTSAKINAAKTVSNPKVFESPFTNNHLPHIESITPYTLIKDAKPVIIQATASDPDGDPIWWSTTLSGLSSTFEKKLLGLSGFFLTNVDNMTVVAGGPYAYQLASELTVGASDQRGGSDTTNTGFEFVRDTQFRRPIAVKTWTVTTNAAAFDLVSVTLDVQDVAKSNYLYGLIINFPDSNIGKVWGIVPSPSPFSFSLGRTSSGFSIRAFLMDRWLNWATTDTVSLRTNGTALLPKCIVAVSTNEGNVPMSVIFDFTQSQRARAYAVFDLFFPSSSSGGLVQTIPFTEAVAHFKMPCVFGTAPGEIDLTVTPIFASRFLGQQQNRIAHLAVQKASNVDGPWSTLTNLTDTIHGDTFYRLEAQ